MGEAAGIFRCWSRLAMVERRLDPALSARVSSEIMLQDAFKIAKASLPEFLRRQQSVFRSGSRRSTLSWLYRVSLDALINTWRKHSPEPRDVRREMPLPGSSSTQLGGGLIEQGPGLGRQFQVSAGRSTGTCPQGYGPAERFGLQ